MLAFRTFIKNIQKPLKFDTKKFETTLKISLFKNTTLELVKILENKRKTALNERFELSGRGERIRTSDTLVPNQVLYQTELRPEGDIHYNCIF